ncbi:GumC family protein [Sphingomonas arantia]|uniref:GumC family protein n=1 Tax=Sphingomonas arantia TaxID=1460676 RepID=A0ABW4U3L5_9SPHN
MTETEAPPAATFGLNEMAAIVYRRRWWLIVPVLLGFAIAIGAVLLTTPSYQSSSTLLIASQQIPTSVMPAAQANYADERIAKIRQQIMSRVALGQIVSTMGLYPEERRRLPLDNVIAQMRQAISVDLVGTNGSAGPAPNGSTIAFRLSFTYRDPAQAQAVTERLTAMFLNADKQLRTEQAAGTAAFLGRRADELREQLVTMAGKRREIEARYAGALPDQVAMSAQSGAGLRAEVSRIDAEQQGLQQQNGLLAARGQEIAATPRQGTDALRRAEERLNQLTSVYADDFPDVVAAREAVARQAELVRSQPAPTGSGAIAAEVAAGRSRIGMLAERRSGLVRSISGMEHKTSLAPQASYELNNLERDYTSLQMRYQDIREKQLEAQVAANLQSEDKGERFSVVDAPSLPNDPLGPDRLTRIAAGIIAGLGAGMVALLAWEILTGAIHGEGGVIQSMGALPLVSVPVLRTGNRSGVATGVVRLLTPWRSHEPV